RRRMRRVVLRPVLTFEHAVAWIAAGMLRARGQPAGGATGGADGGGAAGVVGVVGAVVAPGAAVVGGAPFPTRYLFGNILYRQKKRWRTGSSPGRVMTRKYST